MFNYGAKAFVFVRERSLLRSAMSTYESVRHVSRPHHFLKTKKNNSLRRASFDFCWKSALKTACVASAIKPKRRYERDARNPG